MAQAIGQDNNTVSGSIKMGKRTLAHMESLKKLGYSVEAAADGKSITVSGTEFVEGPIKIGDIREIVKGKKLLTYTTRVKFEDGAVLFGVPACTRLGALSCLVVAGPKKEKATEKSPQATAMDELFAALTK